MNNIFAYSRDSEAWVRDRGFQFRGLTYRQLWDCISALSTYLTEDEWQQLQDWVWNDYEQWGESNYIQLNRANQVADYTVSLLLNVALGSLPQGRAPWSHCG